MSGGAAHGLGGRLRFGLGGLSAQSTTATRDGSHAAIRQTIDIAVLAERCGFDGVWVTEHHFVDDGYLPSPLLMLAAIAERTESVRIGTQVLLAPLYSAIKLAEDAAVLDQLSGGRLVLGLGLGYQDREYAAFGTSRGRRVRQLERCVSAMRAMSAELPIDIGPDYDPGVQIRPLPYTLDGPRVWIGAMSEPGVRRAARIADGFVAPMMSISAFRRRLDWLRDEGVRRQFDLGIYVHAFVAERGAWRLASAGISYVEGQYGRWQQAHSDFANLHTVDRTDMSQPPSHVIVGTPEEVAERLAPWCDALAELDGDGERNVIVRLTYPGVDPGAARDSVELFATRVKPLLGAASLNNTVGRLDPVDLPRTAQ
ncbi:MAG: LLM class flavin-dependent oxidoreductase [Acidimicrobiia bacterium]